MADLEYARDKEVATITLNRVEQRNAFTLTMVDDWVAALTDAQADPDVRVIVVRGAGDAFCAGIDLDHATAALEGSAFDVAEMLRTRIQRIPLLAARLEKPYIAAIRGPAVGAGLDMALMCDMRLAGRSARMGETYVRAGLVPGAGGCHYLPRIVGLAKAFELIATGELIDADTALSIGLVNHVYDDEALFDRTYAFARRLALVPPALMSTLKRTLQRSATSDLETSLELVAAQLGVVRSTGESREAFAAALAAVKRRNEVSP